MAERFYPFKTAAEGMAAGFTLVETVVVVIIIGLLLSISIPDLQEAMSRYRLNTAASLLASDIRFVQQISRERETESSIVFVPEQNMYVLYAGDEALEARALPANVSLHSTTFASNTLQFGASTEPGKAAGSGEIRLQSRNYSFSVTVQVSAPSGEVVVR